MVRRITQKPKMKGTPPREPAIRTYLKEKQLADRFGISPRTLQGHRLRGSGPPFRKWNRSVFYVLEEVESWLDQRRFDSTSDYDLGQADSVGDDEEPEDNEPDSSAGEGARPPPLDTAPLCGDCEPTSSPRGPPAGAWR